MPGGWSDLNRGEEYTGICRGTGTGTILNQITRHTGKQCWPRISLHAMPDRVRKVQHHALEV